jgi:hypothetical protein
VANEIQFTDATGRSDYVTITNAVGLWWNHDFLTFQAYSSANWGSYVLQATEFPTSRVYHANMDPEIPAGVYNVVARNRPGAPLPALTDPVVAVGSIEWTGSAVVADSLALDLAEADEVIRTDLVPWRLEYRKKGTATVLLSKKLKKLDGSDLVGEGVAVGQKVQ